MSAQTDWQGLIPEEAGTLDPMPVEVVEPAALSLPLERALTEYTVAARGLAQWDDDHAELMIVREHLEAHLAEAEKALKAAAREAKVGIANPLFTVVYTPRKSVEYNAELLRAWLPDWLKAVPGLFSEQVVVDKEKLQTLIKAGLLSATDLKYVADAEIVSELTPTVTIKAKK